MLAAVYIEKQTDDLLLGGDNLWVGKHMFSGALFPAKAAARDVKKHGRRLLKTISAREKKNSVYRKM